MAKCEDWGLGIGDWRQLSVISYQLPVFSDQLPVFCSLRLVLFTVDYP
ncbi:hypothetical protein [Scytonema sp. PRP1]